MTVDEYVDERTRFEMFYPPFAAAAAAGVGSVMCRYETGRQSQLLAMFSGRCLTIAKGRSAIVLHIFRCKLQQDQRILELRKQRDFA